MALKVHGMSYTQTQYVAFTAAPSGSDITDIFTERYKLS